MPDALLYMDLNHFNQYKKLRKNDPEKASAVMKKAQQVAYPIIDLRSLWSIGLEVPSKYGFSLWLIYADFCRKLAGTYLADILTLDRALWQYSNENATLTYLF